jgi:hypothetical protein
LFFFFDVYDNSNGSGLVNRNVNDFDGIGFYGSVFDSSDGDSVGKIRDCCISCRFNPICELNS